MNKVDVKKQVEKYYQAFDLMVLSTTLLNSANVDDYEEDSKKIIDFIAQAYSIELSTLEEFRGLILGDMQKIGLISDYLALSSLDLISDYDYENLIFYEIKAKAIERANSSNRKCTSSFDKRSYYDNHSKMKYDSFHHPYNSKIRLYQIEKQAELGDLDSTRQLGIMYYLGIGCESDLDSATLYLSRAMLWGDIPSALLLSKIYSGCDETKSKRFLDLYNTELEYLPKGLIDVQKDSIENGAYNLFILISYIKQFIVVQEHCTDINIPFVNVMMKASIPNSIKLSLILKYKENSWRKYLLDDNTYKRIKIK